MGDKSKYFHLNRVMAQFGALCRKRVAVNGWKGVSSSSFKHIVAGPFHSGFLCCRTGINSHEANINV